MGYARYGKKGKGLSDKAQRRYNRARYTKARSTKGQPKLMETIWDIMYTPTGAVRGLYSSDVATTGKHKGKTFGDIARLDPTYKLPSITPGQRKTPIAARGFAGEMTTRYSKHRGMPQVLIDALMKEKAGEGKGVSGGRALAIGAVGVGLYWVLA